MTDTVAFEAEHLDHGLGELAGECVLVRHATGDRRAEAVLAVPGLAAPTVRRAADLAAEAGELSLFEPDDDLMLFHRNRREAAFIFREVFRDNEYLRHGVTLPERPTVVDVGANIGGASVLFGLVRPDSRIFALEPVPQLCRAVELNARLHGLDVVVIPAAVGDAPRRTQVTYYPKNTAMSGLLAGQSDREVLKVYLAGQEEDATDTAAGLDAVVAELLAGESVECEVQTLGQALAGYAVDRIDLLKIDVEKAEWQVLRGIDDTWWPRIDQVVMEVHDIDGRVAAVVALLEARGFSVLVDRNQDLLDTDMYGVYARRGPVTPDVAAPAWRKPLSTRRALAAALREKLGDEVAAVPVDRFRFVTALPRDERGEIDIGAVLAAVPAGAGAEAAPPAEIEQTLAAIWRRVLKVPDFAASDDFFDLGGTSLKSVRMVLEVGEAFGENVLPPDQLFEGSRFDQVVATIRRNLA
ncbi:FkbM family methyltransferase [Amycolatopsis sp. SID8362]|uniref:FkbM family methyltransferase n=1 Tax=Amycolatopsis sp. SID8362 TaxID=2690346 RepID=UPI0013722924|nr:FkbM family methyltransferase [Amycolatopsis sp. SID8362]NBH11291.1 FkbM family methyltransferase [Amycolatopsis sp. SID8362]NED47983.1 FkbM family methyltransferase [Amycolatopsis sp. SID8362]